MPTSEESGRPARPAASKKPASPPSCSTPARPARAAGAGAARWTSTVDVPKGDAVAHLGLARPEPPGAAVAGGERRVQPLAVRRLRRFPGRAGPHLDPGQLPGAGEQRAVLGPAQQQHRAGGRARPPPPPGGAVAARAAAGASERPRPRRHAPPGSPAAGGRAGTWGRAASRASRRAPSGPGWSRRAGRASSRAPAAASRRARAGRVRRSLGQGEQPGDDALDVAVEHRRGHPEGDARHRRRGVGADPGQRQRGLRRWTGSRPARPPGGRRRGAGAPGGSSRGRTSGRARRRGRRRRAPRRRGSSPGSARRTAARLDPGLLEHHLREPDPVGVGGAAPGQVAAAAVEPGQQLAPQSRGSREIGRVRFGRGVEPIWQASKKLTPRRWPRGEQLGGEAPSLRLGFEDLPLWLGELG